MNCLLCVLLVLTLNPLASRAQSPNDNLRFEVASIRPRVDVGAQRAGIEETPDLVRIENLPLSGIIRMAYGVMNFQLVAPDWTTRARFDIEARPPAPYTSAQRQQMLRNLLTDRFKLEVHNEKRQVTGFDLLVATGGHKLPMATGRTGFFTVRQGLIDGPNRNVADLVSQLTSMVGAPIGDRTGLTDRYDLKLEWTPDGGGAAAAPELSIFTALREQMGLRLEPSRVTIDVVVVDRVERTPTEN
jgi:uncharacterized protein (TIGR03435 family)